MLPTPPDAPVTITSSTFFPISSSSLALTAKAHCKAVRPAVPNIIDCLDDKFLGLFTKNFPSTFAY